MSLPPKIIRALVVDDSAFARKTVREMLAGSPFVEVVGSARDGEEALELVAELKPDVVTCDLLMPRMDGAEFVRRQMALAPLPILVLTAAPQDGPKVVEALNAGAIDIVQKPTALATDDLRRIRTELIEKVQAAARADVQPLLVGASARSAAPRLAAAAAPVMRDVPARAGRVDVVVLGISTGGPQALRYPLPLLPADFPVPIAMVLHMPVGYTALFAEKLDEICALEVREGFSTITMQVARNSFTPRIATRRTLRRKLLELRLARLIEHNLTKDEILEL